MILSSERIRQLDFANRLLLEITSIAPGLFILLEDQIGIALSEMPQKTAICRPGMHVVAGRVVYLAR